MIYFLAGTGESQFPLSSSCSAKAVESSFYVSPYELNANSISDIKTFISRGHPMLKIYPPTQKATVFQTVNECVEGTLRSSYERSGGLLRRVPPYEACGGATGFSPWGLHTLRKRIKMASRDHPSFVPLCRTAGDR
jgi:hypothetical protein